MAGPEGTAGPTPCAAPRPEAPPPRPRTDAACGRGWSSDNERVEPPEIEADSQAAGLTHLLVVSGQSFW